MPGRNANLSENIDPEIESAGHGLTPYALILIGLSLLCFIGAFISNLGAGDKQTFRFSPESENQVEHLKVTKPNSIFQVEVRQSPGILPDNSGWSDVSINIQTPKGEPLIAFGSDFWRASGYDEGRWSETKSKYTMKVTFPLIGTYPVSIESSSSPPNYNQPVTVEFEPRRGSTIPMLLLGVPALLIGIGLGYYSNQNAVKEKLGEWSDN
jgi:hypothetical protein